MKLRGYIVLINVNTTFHLKFNICITTDFNDWLLNESIVIFKQFYLEAFNNNTLFVQQMSILTEFVDTFNKLIAQLPINKQQLNYKIHAITEILEPTKLY